MSLTTAAAPLPQQHTPAADAPAVGPGFRLTRIEVLNWGTFHRTVWSFNTDGASALLTGAAGSGKSTLVDAMTTLLLPAHKIAYNKAAGAEAKERDLRSYVLGYHKNERVEATDSTRPVALRDATSHSVILGVFTNYTLGTHVTLAQVFWVPDANTSQPDRFFLTADRPLSIEADFTRFGTSITDLRRRLKQTGATLYTSYPPYGKALRRSLGIPSEQALDLFHQTVSMKAVGSLDDFVRERMLEPFDAQAAVDKIVAHFDALTASHAEVVRARQMIEHLTPIVEACDRCDAIQAQITLLTRRRDAVPLFFAQRREDALTQLGSNLHTRIRQLTEEQHKRAQHLDGLRLAAEGLRRHIDGAGGERLVELRTRIDELGRERDRRRKRSGEYQSWLERAGLPPVNDPASFHERTTQISRARGQATRHEQQARQELDELAVARHANTTATEAIRREITSLHSQRSSIPARLLDLRQDLAAAAGVAVEELPFAGELIQVRDSETEWAGAAERVLRSFALSLLVPEAHYANVSQWVNGRHLGLRLVYYRVPAHIRPTELPTDPSFLTGKLELNQDSWAHDWLATQLRSRADYHCAGDLDTFTRSTRPAVTKQGLIKNGGGRHEKDDTSRVDDRRSWVLGWTNQAKLTALLEEAQRLTQESAEITERTRALKQQESSRSGIRDALALLANVENHHEIDWQAAVLELEELQQRKRTLETEAGLDKLTTELQEAEEGIKHGTKEFDTSQEHLGSLRNEHKRVAAQLDKTTALLQRADLTDTTEHRDALTAFLPGPTDSVQHLLEQLDAAETLAAQQLLHTRESRTEAYRRAASQAASKMATFRDTYRQFTTDLDSSIEAADGYRQLHNRLTDDDLPRFETQFLQYLRTNVIRDIASFQAHLSAQEQQIRERIQVINASLAAINYNPGRYIRLNAAPTPSVEIRDFRRDLRTCTSDALATDPDDAYTEEKFLQVKQLLDRFKGRPEHTRHDADWTARVTDVRRWFVFNASEVNRADDTEHEVHSDSGGKSGGQKEKLAYTILAASLAYQFRIDSGNSKTFRFVVIDEAFGRGDDPSAHFALDLFQRLGLQLLVVTPLQKLHVIEPHVTRVGYVDRPDTVRSRLNTLTIEEFRAARMKAAQMPAPRRGSQP